jgi:hypothetical protein
MFRPLYAGKEPGTHYPGGWVRHRAGLDLLNERKISCPLRVSNPGPSSPTALSWLQCTLHTTEQRELDILFFVQTENTFRDCPETSTITWIFVENILSDKGLLNHAFRVVFSVVSVHMISIVLPTMWAFVYRCRRMNSWAVWRHICDVLPGTSEENHEMTQISRFPGPNPVPPE